MESNNVLPQELIHQFQLLPDKSEKDGLLIPHGVFEQDFSAINVEPTFAGSEYYDSSLYLKFNNAIERMSKQRVVASIEVDIEYIARNYSGTCFAVVIHFPDGDIGSDMLTKVKSGGWMLYQSKFRFHPNFISNYISSIWGYKKVNELQVAREICDFQYVVKTSTAIVENFALRIYPGGIAIIRCAKDGDNIRPKEAVDFVPYEMMGQDELKEIYGSIVQKFAANDGLGVIELPENIVMPTLETSLARLKEKYGE